MKCHKPNTDQEVELKVFANGSPCSEHALAGCNDDPNIAECYIAVKPGDHMTIKGAFSGSVLQASFDLVIDGSFLAGSRIEGTRGGIKNYNKRKIGFKKVLQCPLPKGWTSIETPSDLFEGKAVVTPLSDEDEENLLYHSTGSGTAVVGLGSIAIIVCLSQDAAQTHKNSYSDITCGRWRERDLSIGTRSTIAPDFAMDVVIPPDGTKVSDRKSAKHRRNQFVDRFGATPWAKFVFYYRSRSALDMAGCAPMSPEVRELDPHLPEPFIYMQHVPVLRNTEGAAGLGIDGAGIEGRLSPSTSSSGLFVSTESSRFLRKQSRAAEQQAHCELDSALTADFAQSAIPEEEMEAFQTFETSTGLGQEMGEMKNEEEALEPAIVDGGGIESIIPMQDYQAHHFDDEPWDAFAEDGHEQANPLDVSEISDEQMVNIRPFPSLLPSQQPEIVEQVTNDDAILPSIEEIKMLFESHGERGVPGMTLLNFFKERGPYDDTAWAQDEFKHRYQEIAVMDSSTKAWKLRGDDPDNAKPAQKRQKSTTASRATKSKPAEKSSATTVRPSPKRTKSAQDKPTPTPSFGKPIPGTERSPFKWTLDPFHRSSSIKPPPALPSPTPTATHEPFPRPPKHKSSFSSLLLPPPPFSSSTPPPHQQRPSPFKKVRTAAPSLPSGSSDEGNISSVEIDVRRAQHELQEKHALKAALRDRIRAHDDRHEEQLKSKRDEAARKRLEEIQRESEEMDVELEEMRREEELKRKGMWDWGEEAE